MLNRRQIMTGAALGGASMLAAPRIANAAISLKTQHPTAEANIWGASVAQAMDEQVEKFSNGRINVETFWNSSLIPYKDHYRGLEKGVLDFGYINLGNHPGVFTAYEIFQLPGLAPKLAPSSYVINELERRYPDVFKGQFSDEVHLLSGWQFALADLHTTSKKVESLADLQGMAIGVQNEPVANAMKALGASPSIIPFSEANQQLERGVIDGMIAGWSVMQITKAYEVAKNHTELRMFPNAGAFLFNKRSWDKLDPVDQAVFSQMVPWFQQANVHGMAQTGKYLRDNEITEANGHATVTLPEDDYAKIRTLFEPFWESWAKTAEDKGLPGRKLLEDTVYLTEMYSYE